MAMLKPKTKADAGNGALPQLVDYPEYRAAVEARDKCRGQLQDAEREISLLTSPARAQERAGSLRAHAKAFLATGHLPDPDQELNERKQTQTATLKVAVLKEALQIQEDQIRELGVKFSRKICEEVAPQHRELVRQVAAAVLDVLKANEKQVRMMDELGAAGVHRSMPHAHFALIGELRDSQSGGCIYIRELVSQGMLDKTDPIARTLEVAHEGSTVR
jgi:hypothetical protein